MAKPGDGKSLEEKIEDLEAELAPFYAAEDSHADQYEEYRADMAREENWEREQELQAEAAARGMPVELLLKEQRLESLRRQKETRRKADAAREEKRIQMQNEAFETARSPLENIARLRWEPLQAVRRTLFWGASAILGALTALTVADRVRPSFASWLLWAAGSALASVIISMSSHAVISFKHSRTVSLLRSRIERGERLSDQEILELNDGGRTLALDWTLVLLQLLPLVAALICLAYLLWGVLTPQEQI